MATSTPNNLAELMEMNSKTPLQEVLETVSELSIVDQHNLVMRMLDGMKDGYQHFYSETENDLFLWDGCKVGTCLQVFMSLELMRVQREMNQKDKED